MKFLLSKLYRLLNLEKVSFFRSIRYFYVFYIFNSKKNKYDNDLKNLYFKKEDRNKLLKYKNFCSGEACVIIGNGPSLNKIDFDKLSNIKTFGVNSFFLLTEKLNFKPTFYTVEDNLVFEDNIENIKNYEVEHKFFPHDFKKYLNDTNANYFFRDSRYYRDEYNIPKKTNLKFSKNFNNIVYSGHTVTYINLQLAYFMGFKTIYLIGMDFDYKEPKSLIKKGNIWQSTEKDPNHFDENYFGPGKRWHNPQLDKVKIAYEKSKYIFENNNRNIINLTIGGKLEIFQRDDFESIFN